MFFSSLYQTKEEVAPTLEAVQNIQSVSQALQKSKENYNSKTIEQERMRKEGSTQRDVDKVHSPSLVCRVSAAMLKQLQNFHR